ncbi:Pseudo ankyrin repeat-like [Cedratvirus A11]|uniref:Pseudo ankyrin repeat-like n=1 Tax=Cedratvirus A11 TaxID=1903266 RepID=A0A1M7XUY8_9VIRU|nr:Pseudo ankyrin repeat-like [Cedratvirus A11]SHO33499.1 Pseudo ankyrin repeat-like [Cedratvirus A11]
MDYIYKTIFSFSEGYNYRNRHVCFEFKEMIPKVDPLFYLDSLCRDGRVPEKIKSSDDIAKKAIALGCVNILRWSNREHIPNNICELAAISGQPDVLKWARLNRFPWNSYTCNKSIQLGYWEVFRWAVTNGCPRDENTCSYTAKYGNLEMLQLLRASGCPWTEWVCINAAYSGNLEMLQWARSQGWFYHPCDKILYKA